MRPAHPHGPGVAITGIGLSSSLGDAHTACAAARAGLSRPAELALQVIDDETGAPEAVSGHPVPSVAGFIGRARLVALAEEAYGDLASRCPELGRTDALGFFLCLADQDSRRWAPGDPDPDDAHDPDYEPLQSPTPREQERADAEEREAIAAQILELTGAPVRPAARRVFALGAPGLAVAIEQAAAALSAGQLGACVVGAVDSLVQPAALRFLHEGARLKTPDDPNGLIPGEAAAFLLLERADWAQQRRQPILGRIAGTAAEQGEDPDVVDRPPRGTALLSLFSRLLAGAPASSSWALTDQNGQTFRALEWADFLLRASGRLPEDPGAWPLWYPAISFGDTGAASGALAACMAVRAFSRGYAPAPVAIVVSAAHEGGRGAIRIEQPEPPQRR